VARLLNFSRLWRKLARPLSKASLPSTARYAAKVVASAMAMARTRHTHAGETDGSAKEITTHRKSAKRSRMPNPTASIITTSIMRLCATRARQLEEPGGGSLPLTVGRGALLKVDWPEAEVC